MSLSACPKDVTDSRVLPEKGPCWRQLELTSADPIFQALDSWLI